MDGLIDVLLEYEGIGWMDDETTYYYHSLELIELSGRANDISAYFINIAIRAGPY
tara:strand:+ start:361 stop:525 length:165 start_codon:yes stop_codon:yes gene_type:complete